MLSENNRSKNAIDEEESRDEMKLLSNESKEDWLRVVMVGKSGSHDGLVGVVEALT